MIMIAMAWVIASLLFALPLSGIWGEISSHEFLNWMCDIRDGQSFKVFAIVAVFVTSLITLIGCYYSIFRKLKEIRREVSVYFTAEKNTSERNADVKMIKMMLIVIFGYLFTSFPTSIFHVGIIKPGRVTRFTKLKLGEGIKTILINFTIRPQNIK